MWKIHVVCFFLSLFVCVCVFVCLFVQQVSIQQRTGVSRERRATFLLNLYCSVATEFIGKRGPQFLTLTLWTPPPILVINHLCSSFSFVWFVVCLFVCLFVCLYPWRRPGKGSAQIQFCLFSFCFTGFYIALSDL